VVASLVLVILAGLLALRLPDDRPDAGYAAAVPPSGGASADPAVPPGAAPPAENKTPPRPADALPPAGPTTPLGQDARPAPTDAARVPTDAAGVPGGAGTPGRTATATPTQPAPTTTSAPEPQERTLTSAGGTVRADCPSPATARLLSWSPARTYRVEEVSEGPAAEAVAVFRHGSERVRMTVTCSGGVPSTDNTGG
jgi:serine/threonine-protein kinase